MVNPVSSTHRPRRMPLPSFFRSSSSSVDLSHDASASPATSPAYNYLPTPSPSRASMSSSNSAVRASFSSTHSAGASSVDPIRRPSLCRIDSLLSTHSFTKSPPTTSLGIVIESPPLVFYGGASTSTGALLSGQLKIDVAEDELEVEEFTMRLVVDSTMKRPYHANCAACTTQSSDLTTWTFLQSPTVLGRGEHSFPFSFLLPGQYQVCTHSSLASVTYTLRALLTPAATITPSPTSLSHIPRPPLKLNHPLTVVRAIRPPAAPRRYIRDFPPTTISAHLSLPQLIHPSGAFPASLIVRGMKNAWVLRRLSWRLDETQAVIAPACAKHAPRSGSVRGVVRSAFCTLGAGEISSGWTVTESGDVGPEAHLEFTFGPAPPSVALCDVKTEDGTETAHALVVELLVESAAGTRLLRMRFNPFVTERGEEGGVSWDEEAPPVYGDGGRSPPGYVGEVPGYDEIMRGFV